MRSVMAFTEYSSPLSNAPTALSTLCGTGLYLRKTSYARFA